MNSSIDTWGTLCRSLLFDLFSGRGLDWKRGSMGTSNCGPFFVRGRIHPTFPCDQKSQKVEVGGLGWLVILQVLGPSKWKPF